MVDAQSARSPTPNQYKAIHGGHSIPVHGLKLKLASSVLNEMITLTLDDQIASAAAKRRKTADGGSTAARQDMPNMQV